MLIIVLLLCALFCGFVQWTLKRRHMLKLTSKIPAYPGAYPIIGHAYKLMFGDTVRLLELLKEVSDYTNANEGIATVWFRMTPHFIITDPVDAAIVLNNCLDKTYVYHFLSPWLGNGLFTAKLSIWKEHRRMINPAFSPKVLNGFQPTFDRQSRKLVESFRDKVGCGPFDPSYCISINALETICETAIGIPADGEKVVDDSYVTACHKMLSLTMARIINIWMHFDFIYNLTRSRRERDRAVKILYTSSLRVVEKRTSEFNNNLHTGDKVNKFKPFLELLFDLAAHKGVFNHKEMREEVDAMIFGGHDTSSVLLTYILVMLGSHREVQDLAYEELKGIFGESNRSVEKGDLELMKYLEIVIFETLRLYPLGSVLGRDVYKDTQLTNYVIPAGSSCIISFWGIHRGPLWGPDAEKFKPERWLDPSSIPDYPAAFGGFSLGKRMCIGKNYAIMSIKTTISHILRNYRIVADHNKMKLKLDMMLRPIEGHFISLEAR